MPCEVDAPCCYQVKSYSKTAANYCNTLIFILRIPLLVGAAEVLRLCRRVIETKRQPITAQRPSNSEGCRSLLGRQRSSCLAEVKALMFSCLPHQRPAERACLDSERAPQTESLHKQCHQLTSFESSQTYTTTTSTFHSTLTTHPPSPTPTLSPWPSPSRSPQSCCSFSPSSASSAWALLSLSPPTS